MPTADRILLDTNILVFGRLEYAPLYKTVQQRLTDLAAVATELWISRQILREFLSSMSRGKGMTAIPSM